ncbi:MAG: endonuclease/exonuclease/phosphatase family protein [Candidatus Thorarchaeota archaeon]
MPDDPLVTDKLPKKYEKGYNDLRKALDDAIPPKATDSNLIIATWNIMSFGGLTSKWETKSGDKPMRNLLALKYIAEIISRFDVVAIQEVKGNLRALRHLLKALGPDWGLMMSDEVRGERGNYERFAYIFDTRRVRLSGMAGEFVIPTDELETKEFPLDKQFARTPYAVGFKAGKRTFVLVTLHVVYGKENEVKVAERAEEMLSIAGWLSEWARDINIWEQNLIALGDFNIDRAGDHLYTALISSGLDIHEHFYDLPRTIYDPKKRPKERTFYDQIAWFTGYDGKPALSMRFRKGGYFDFSKYVYTDKTKKQIASRMSDHFPLWAEFELDPIEEEEIPSLPSRLTTAMKERQKENVKKRKLVVQSITELDNAFLMYIDETAEAGLEVELEAEQYLKRYLFSYRLVNKFKELLMDGKVDQETPIKVTEELLKKTEEVLGTGKTVTEAILKETMRALNTWPYERRYIRE